MTLSNTARTKSAKFKKYVYSIYNAFKSLMHKKDRQSLNDNEKDHRKHLKILFKSYYIYMYK